MAEFAERQRHAPAPARVPGASLAFGRGENEDKSRTETTYAKTREFMDRFQARHGSCICRTLLDGCDLLTEDGQRQYKARDLLNETCKPCVRSAGEILEDLLPRL